MEAIPRQLRCVADTIRYFLCKRDYTYVIAQRQINRKQPLSSPVADAWAAIAPVATPTGFCAAPKAMVVRNDLSPNSAANTNEKVCRIRALLMEAKTCQMQPPQHKRGLVVDEQKPASHRAGLQKACKEQSQLSAPPVRKHHSRYKKSQRVQYKAGLLIRKVFNTSRLCDGRFPELTSHLIIIIRDNTSIRFATGCTPVSIRCMSTCNYVRLVMVQRTQR